MSSGDNFADEFRVVKLGGDVRWFASRGRIVRDSGGRPLRIIGLNYDITAQKETEIHLQHMVERRTSDLRIMNVKLAEAQEQERRRIAAGLHDEACQLLWK